jgi:hypothetical protein
MQKTREQQITELLNSIEQQSPYEYNSKLYWIYMAGLYSVILKQRAMSDYILSRDLTEIAARLARKQQT